MPRATSRLIAFIVRFAVLGLAIAFLVSTFAPDLARLLRGDRAGAPSGSVNGPNRLSGAVSYAEAVSRAAPAVVSIYANKVTTVRQYRIVPDPLTQRLFGAVSPPYLRREQSLGSGVVFSADGYVLTNFHVISGADDIQILLSDGSVVKASVIGSDADTDLAVLKVEARSLTPISVAENSTANVGDVVLAIGDPFGIGKTVTMGIVSATGRQLRLSAYEDFIQTDAAINSGNSGGALVNAFGELVGINTAVGRDSRQAPGGQGAEGIGFAIPVATAKAVLDQIVRHGMVIRGWVGIDYADAPAVDPSRPAVRRGIVVMEVHPDSPAAVAGLLAGDILLTLDGRDIIDATDLRMREAGLTPGTVVRVEGRRKGLPFSIDLTMMQRPGNYVTET